MPLYKDPSQEEDIDFDSLELMFLHIVDYRVFKNANINLNAEYLFTFVIGDKDSFPEITVKPNKDYVDLFKDYNINLKVICGENASGKSTILDIINLHSIHENKSFYLVLKDCNNNYLSTNKMIVNENNLYHTLDTQVIEGNDYPILGNKYSTEGLEYSLLKKDLGLLYYKERELFESDRQDPMFDFFVIDIFEYYSSLNIIEDRRLLKNFDGEHPHEYPVVYLFLQFLYPEPSDDEPPELVESLKKHLESENETIEEIWNELFSSFTEEEKNTIKSYSTELKKLLSKTGFKLEQLDEKKTLLYDLLDRIDDFYYKYFTKNKLIESFENNDNFRTLFYFKPYKKHSDSKIFFEHFSNGEQLELLTKHKLFTKMQHIKGGWIYDDEPDAHLHPESKRQFIYRYLESFKTVRSFLSIKNFHYLGDTDKVKTKRYSIILTTHSPFILSDFHKNNIIFLEKDGRETTVKENNDIKDTFAGNIGEMFYDTFFMSSTTGEFAKNTIMKALEKLKESNITVEEKEEYKKLFNSVGDTLMRNLLLDKIH